MSSETLKQNINGNNSSSNGDKNPEDKTNSDGSYYIPPKKTIPDEKGELYGHDLYPERRGNKKKTIKKTLLMYDGQENLKKYHCENMVYNCVLRHPLVKLMMGALKSSGCPIDLRRHFSCEECDTSVTGGYDPELNQIVICQNNVKIESIASGVLTHEMIHMFDYCRNELDFKNIDHLACTEVRAANLTYCSAMSAVVDGDAKPWNFSNRHKVCVKRRAMLSVLAARNVTIEEATAAVERVFDKCYNDMEPIGRRIRRGSNDMEKALNDAPYYGYDK